MIIDFLDSAILGINDIKELIIEKLHAQGHENYEICDVKMIISDGCYVYFIVDGDGTTNKAALMNITNKSGINHE